MATINPMPHTSAPTNTMAARASQVSSTGTTLALTISKLALMPSIAETLRSITATIEKMVKNATARPGSMHSAYPIEVAMPIISVAMITLPMLRGLKNDPMVTSCPFAMSSTPPMYADWIAATTTNMTSDPSIRTMRLAAPKDVLVEYSEPYSLDS